MITRILALILIAQFVYMVIHADGQQSEHLLFLTDNSVPVINRCFVGDDPNRGGAYLVKKRIIKLCKSNLEYLSRMEGLSPDAGFRYVVEHEKSHSLGIKSEFEADKRAIDYFVQNKDWEPIRFLVKVGYQSDPIYKQGVDYAKAQLKKHRISIN